MPENHANTLSHQIIASSHTHADDVIKFIQLNNISELTTINNQVSANNNQADALAAKVATIDSRLDTHNSKLSIMATEQAGVKQRLKGSEERLDGLEQSLLRLTHKPIAPHLEKALARENQKPVEIIKVKPELQVTTKMGIVASKIGAPEETTASPAKMLSASEAAAEPVKKGLYASMHAFDQEHMK